MRIKIYLLSIIALFCCYTSFAQIPVPFSSRLPGGNLKRQGEIVLVGNSILNKTSNNATINSAGVITNLAALTAQANTPYNGNLNNNGFNQEYTDVDTDVTTFSSRDRKSVV